MPRLTALCFVNPNGIPSLSPGCEVRAALASRATLGNRPHKLSNPEVGCILALVAADVSPLQSSAVEFEPTHVGCYTEGLHTFRCPVATTRGLAGARLLGPCGPLPPANFFHSFPNYSSQSCFQISPSPNAERLFLNCSANTEVAFLPGRSPRNPRRAATNPFALGVCSPIRRMAGCEILRAPYSLR